MSDQNQKSSRRSFLKNLFVIGATAGAGIVFLRNLILYAFPRVKPKTYHKYLITREGEIPVGKAKEVTIGREPVFVVHLESGYKVFSGICTHLGCIVRWEETKERFYCPCHKGVFDKTGAVVSGPPPKPLNQYRVEVEKDLVFLYVEDKIKGPWS